MQPKPLQKIQGSYTQVFPNKSNIKNLETSNRIRSTGTGFQDTDTEKSPEHWDDHEGRSNRRNAPNNRGEMLLAHFENRISIKSLTPQRGPSLSDYDPRFRLTLCCQVYQTAFYNLCRIFQQFHSYLVSRFYYKSLIYPL